MRISGLILCLLVIAFTCVPICVRGRGIDEIHGRLLKNPLSLWERAGVRGEASKTAEESFSFLPYLSDPHPNPLSKGEGTEQPSLAVASPAPSPKAQTGTSNPGDGAAKRPNALPPEKANPVKM